MTAKKKPTVRRKRRRLMTSALLALLILWMPLLAPCEAAVTATAQAESAGGAITVAGNPAWYPIEYYDSDSRSYEGILPALLEEVSEETGLNFTYIQAGEEDRRSDLAKNNRAAIISACRGDETWLKEADVTTKQTVIAIPLENGTQEVCLFFTDSADESLVNAIREAVNGLDAQTVAGLSVQLIEDRSADTVSWGLVVAVAVTVLAVIVGVLAMIVRRYRKSLQQDNSRDALTGAWSKRHFVDYFDRVISDRNRSLYSVVYIGFDIAKVNQYYGEKAAEEQLCYAAKELMGVVRANEAVARVSGGGFAVARLNTGEEETEAWTAQVLTRLNGFTALYGRDYRPVFRAGIYMLQPLDRDCEEVLGNARKGYQQAANSDLPYVFIRLAHLEQEHERLQLKKQVMDALQNREIQMYLQFIVDAENGQICGAEAISRWAHPQKGLLHPSSYIDLMESEGTIVELDFYIFEEVCRQLAQWAKEGSALRLSCNFARITIGRKNFVERIKEISDRYTFDHRYLVLEITEDAMETNKEMAFANISQCKEMGFLIALDDAGDGYTSFADLRDYPLDIVKIDRTILNEATTSRGIALLRGIIALVHNLGMKVLCEGAETEEQVALLREMECDYIQGFYFYKPLPWNGVEEILKDVDFQDMLWND